MTEQNQGDNHNAVPSTDVVASTAPQSVQDKIKRSEQPSKASSVPARLGWLAKTVLALSLLLAVAAAGLVG